MNESAAPLVVVVDDVPLLLDLVRDCLEEEGYRVTTCLQSKDVWEVLARERPAALMLDILMPEVSGWQILERLGAEPEFADLPVIICTAFVEEALGRLQELRSSGAEARHLGLLPKPFDLEELLDVVGSVIVAGTSQPPA